MGGIAGIVHFDGTQPNGARAEAMAHALEHRGPDGLGIWQSEQAVVTHRRRCVVPGRSPQPVVTDEAVLSMDGWLFDHERLALSMGVDPTGRSDVYSLLAAWQRYGAELGRHVEGEYAVAVWNQAAGVLTLLRDRMGTRPLYWCRVGGKVAFASDIPALLEAGFVPRTLRRDAVAEYLSFLTVHAPRTLLADVHQVEPGSWVQIDADGVRSSQWYQARFAPVEGQDVAERLREAVSKSVRRRLDGLQSCGLLLSGGLGSTAIATAAKDRFVELPTFTVSFDDDRNPESAFAGRIAHLFDLEHHEVIVDSHALAESFEATVRALGHPIARAATVMQLLLARAARERVRVVLSGDGGEELFGGRMLDSVARRLRAARSWSRLPRPLRSPAEALLSQVDRGQGLRTPMDHWALAMGLGGDELFGRQARAALLRDDELVGAGVRQRVLEPWYRDLDADPIHTVLHGYLRSRLQGVAIPAADRTAAAAGLDVRFPLLDHEVLAVAAALPSEAKIVRVGDQLHTRLPMQAMLKGALPPALLNRPKRGLPKPLGSWLAGPGRLFLESRLQLLKEDPHQLYKPEALEALKRRVIHNETEAGNQLWGLFILDAWLRQVVGRASYQGP